MDKNNDIKKNFYLSFKNIKKIWLPIILTIFLVLNIPFVPNSVGTNVNMNLQPGSGSGESYFFSSSYFKNKNKSIKRDGSTALWVLFLILCVIFGIVYFVMYKVKDTNEQKVENTDYVELLKDDSDYEGII